MKDTLVIIPAYNEEMNIGTVIAKIRQMEINVDIIVINDGSKDLTEEIAKGMGVEVISLPFNLGYGAAMQTGFKYAALKGYNYVVQFDADGQHDPDDISTIVKELRNGSKHIIIGSRFLGRGTLKPGILKRVAISVFRFIILLSNGVKITDPTSGLQGLSRPVFTHYARMGNYPKDFPDADVLIQMLYHGCEVYEFPANMKSRNSGSGMHSGLKPIIYFMKILLSIFVIVLRKNLVKGSRVL